MQVLAYPVNLSRDVKGLPTVKTEGGLLALRVEFGDHVGEELVMAFIIATRKGCDWLVFKDTPIVRDEIQWVSLKL